MCYPGPGRGHSFKDLSMKPSPLRTLRGRKMSGEEAKESKRDLISELPSSRTDAEGPERLPESPACSAVNIQSPFLLSPDGSYFSLLSLSLSPICVPEGVQAHPTPSLPGRGCPQVLGDAVSLVASLSFPSQFSEEPQAHTWVSLRTSFSALTLHRWARVAGWLDPPCTRDKRKHEPVWQPRSRTGCERQAGVCGLWLGLV